MDDMEYIDQFFSEPSTSDQVQFDQRILSDPAFAEQVAFYLATRQALQKQEDQETKQRFRQIYQPVGNLQPVRSISPIRKIMRYAAAAIVIGAVAGTFYLMNTANGPREMADENIKKSLSEIGPKMSTAQDSLWIGKQLSQAGKYEEALVIFDGLLAADKSNFEAEELAGKVSHLLERYDEALVHFEKLAADSSIHVNPGKFLIGNTLVKRNQPGDIERAKKLFEEVINNNLAEKERAIDMLKKLK